jgi:hypothetical protein
VYDLVKSSLNMFNAIVVYSWYRRSDSNIHYSCWYYINSKVSRNHKHIAFVITDMVSANHSMVLAHTTFT